MRKLFSGKILIIIILLSLISSVPALAKEQEYKVTKVKGDFTVFGDHYFHDGLLPVMVNYEEYYPGYWTTYDAYLDRNGEILILNEYVSGFDFSEGLAPVLSENVTKLGYMDTTGNIVIPMIFDVYGFEGILQAGRFVDGHALVFEYIEERYVDYGGYSVWEPYGIWHTIDRTGKKVDKKLSEDTIYSSKEGIKVEKSETINILGKTIENVVFSENLALVKIPEGPDAGYYVVEKIVKEQTTQPNKPSNKVTPSESKVLVNGKEINFDAYLIEGNNYFKLRDLAYVVRGTEKQFEVTWDGAKKAINLITNTPYTSNGEEMVKGDGKVVEPTFNNSKIYLDGKEVTLTAYTINGNNYFKLRDIGKLFDFGITWENDTKTVGIDTSIGYSE